MSDAVLSPGDESINEAGLEGIGNTTASRLKAVGVSTVRELAEADGDRLAANLASHYEHWKTETLREHVGQWIRHARAHSGTSKKVAPRGHAFLLTLWVDDRGHPLRSRYGYRRSAQAKAEEVSQELVGWSPFAFTRFVERHAGLVEANDLSEERVEPTRLIEWSKHRVDGQLVRAHELPVTIRARMATGHLPTAEGVTRWRVVGSLVPFGDAPRVNLGICAGSVEPGEPIEVEFDARIVRPGLYRAWFEVGISPPADAGHAFEVRQEEVVAAR